MEHSTCHECVPLELVFAGVLRANNKQINMQPEPNKPELKLAMAKLLPELIEVKYEYGSSNSPTISWLNRPQKLVVLETEWLYVMQLVWESLDSRDERIKYVQALHETVIAGGGHETSSPYDIQACCENATFNQRATAMCRVKGIKL